MSTEIICQGGFQYLGFAVTSRINPYTAFLHSLLIISKKSIPCQAFERTFLQIFQKSFFSFVMADYCHFFPFLYPLFCHFTSSIIYTRAYGQIKTGIIYTRAYGQIKTGEKSPFLACKLRFYSIIRLYNPKLREVHLP